MTWVLAITGLALILIGFWIGPRTRRKDEAAAPADPSHEEAWDILGQPLYRAEEIARAGEQGSRRFQQGVLVGLGIGLMIAGGVTLTRPAAVQPTAPSPGTAAGQTPAPPEQPGGQPAPSAPATPGQPAEPPAQPTVPAEPPAPAQPPKPANITFAVEPGELAPAIAAHLKAEGLIADEDAFLTRVAELGLDTSLKAGTFVVPTDAPLDDVIEVLTR